MKFNTFNKKSKKSIIFILIFLVTTFFFSVSLATLAVHAANVVQDYSFEWNNGTWINSSTNGGIAYQSTTSQHYQGAASGETSTTGSTGTSTAVLNQTISHYIRGFNYTNSLSWWNLWQSNATTGARDCYLEFSSDILDNLYYWYNLNNAAPSSIGLNYYITVANPTWQTWT